MLIQLTKAGEDRQSEIISKSEFDDILGQLTEECGELIQAAQKYIRANKGTTPLSQKDARKNLCEECADVALCIDILIRSGMVDEDRMQSIGRAKNDRWHKRIVEGYDGLQSAD